MEKPTFLKEEHLKFLDALRVSGVTNMLGAAPYVQAEYPDLTKVQGTKVLSYWMKTFDERHKE